MVHDQCVGRVGATGERRSGRRVRRTRGGSVEGRAGVGGGMLALVVVLTRSPLCGTRGACYLRPGAASRPDPRGLDGRGPAAYDGRAEVGSPGRSRRADGGGLGVAWDREGGREEER